MTELTDEITGQFNSNQFDLREHKEAEPNY